MNLGVAHGVSHVIRQMDIGSVLMLGSVMESVMGSFDFSYHCYQMSWGSQICFHHWIEWHVLMVGMSGECSAGRVLNRLDWCESFNPMFCIKCRLIRQWIDGWNVLGCSVIYGHRLISGPKEFIYLILTTTATFLTHLTSGENISFSVFSFNILPFFSGRWIFFINFDRWIKTGLRDLQPGPMFVFV